MAGRRLNVNVGVLGHIDSGKTALARALSTTASTAAFDKQPQSRERGITLDLGFSCFSVPLPARLRPALPGADADAEPGAEPRLQVTLVDCPGHASLIRTIIGEIPCGLPPKAVKHPPLPTCPQLSRAVLQERSAARRTQCRRSQPTGRWAPEGWSGGLC